MLRNVAVGKWHGYINPISSKSAAFIGRGRTPPRDRVLPSLIARRLKPKGPDSVATRMAEHSKFQITNSKQHRAKCFKFYVLTMSSSEQDTLSHFAALDELIQLIYQGAHKFVVISSVGQLSWDVHLGLTGPDGRWWKGKWTEKDIQQFVVRSVSSAT